MKVPLIFSVHLLLLAGLSFAAAGQTPSGAAKSILSGAADRRSLKLVVYNNDLALVNEKRLLRAARGSFELRFQDVGRQIIPASLVLETGGRLTVLEQHYAYNLLTKDRLLESYLGRPVTLERLDPRTNTRERVSGTLLSLAGGTVIRFEDHVEIDPQGTFILPEVPAEFVIQPALTWLVKASASGDCPLEVSYLTRGLSWSCDYVLTLEGGGDKARLAGWVTVNNSSGTDYDGAELSLVAGELNLVQTPPAPGRPEMTMKSFAPQLAARAMGDQMTPEQGFEYYRYHLGRVTSLPNNELKQVELFQPAGLAPRKTYRFEGAGNLYYGPLPSPPGPRQVSVLLEWENGAKNAPGVPLPAGVIRIYERSGDDAPWFLGEDRIGHTPLEEKISIRAGSAFDLLAVEKQIDYRKLSDRLRQVSVEIELTNRKTVEATVEVDEPLPGDWKIIENSLPFERLQADRIRFRPKVPAGGKTRVSFTVQVL